MAALDAIIGPVAVLLDKVIPDPKARDAAKLELLKLQGSQDLQLVKAQLSAIVAEAQSSDPWTSRARPSFLYVMYTLLLWAIPMGLIAAVRPEMAAAIGQGMTGYLAAIRSRSTPSSAPATSATRRRASGARPRRRTAERFA